MIEYKPFLRQTGGQFPDSIGRKPGGFDKLFQGLGRLFAKRIDQFQLGFIIADGSGDNRDGCFTDRELNHPLFTDHFGSASEPGFNNGIVHEFSPSFSSIKNPFSQYRRQSNPLIFLIYLVKNRTFLI